MMKKRGRPKGSKNKPKVKVAAIRTFDPSTFVEEEEDALGETRESEERVEGVEDTSLAIYTRIPQYEKRAQIFLRDEGKLEAFIQEKALVLMQMEADQAMLMPTTRSEISAAIKARYNFVQKAQELLQLLIENKVKRIEEVEARNEMLARGGGEREEEVEGA